MKMMQSTIVGVWAIALSEFFSTRQVVQKVKCHIWGLASGCENIVKIFLDKFTFTQDCTQPKRKWRSMGGGSIGSVLN